MCVLQVRAFQYVYPQKILRKKKILLPAAHAVIFVTTTPLPSPSDHSITMSCIRQYNRIAREVAAEAAGPVFLADLWGDVERFCDVDGDAFNISRDANFTRCALMCTGPRACGRMGMHFMDAAPWPSGCSWDWPW